MIRFKVVDWAGNEIFDGQIFRTFEGAWDHIREVFPNEDDWQEYLVVSAF